MGMAQRVLSVLQTTVPAIMLMPLRELSLAQTAPDRNTSSPRLSQPGSLSRDIQVWGRHSIQVRLPPAVASKFYIPAGQGRNERCRILEREGAPNPNLAPKRPHVSCPRNTSRWAALHPQQLTSTQMSHCHTVGPPVHGPRPAAVIPVHRLCCRHVCSPTRSQPRLRAVSLCCSRGAEARPDNVVPSQASLSLLRGLRHSQRLPSSLSSRCRPQQCSRACAHASASRVHHLRLSQIPAATSQ
ncbi:hypothetical protein NDU88_002239 [Pleurodeles waltl]|uniref:Secreted protein n=1 Tax=Pleurodeles waltl TaxID=8319 RepID=A0AAV7M3I1_PLEWA|nr:hypothetical protein NDU88_002239 [Pleurodeles waltl]